MRGTTHHGTETQPNLHHIHIRRDICCVCGQFQAQSTTRHWEPFDLSTFQARPMTPCTPNCVFATVDDHPASTQQPVASDAEFRQAALASDLLRKRRNPVRKCRVALKGTTYRRGETDRGFVEGGDGEELPTVPTQRCKHTTIVGASSSGSSSNRGSSKSSGGDTSTESVTTSDGEDASAINLDEAGLSDMSPAVYMLSEPEEFELKD